MIKLKYLVVCLCILPGISAFAQSDSPSVQPSHRMNGWTFGVGTSNVLDTYLSPYNYTGVDLRLTYETIRRTKRMDGHLYYQTLLDADGSILDNRSGSADEYAGGIRYSNAWMYGRSFASSVSERATNSRSSLFAQNAWWAGLQPSVYVGGIYNSRNGNNPAQAKVDLMINATAMASYGLHLFGRVFPVRYQLTVPLVGIAYSPNYGQSYYEEFVLGHYDHNVCFGHVGNMPSMRHLLTLDIPLRKSYLRIGWSGQFNQARLNGLRYHSYNNNLMVGYNKCY